MMLLLLFDVVDDFVFFTNRVGKSSRQRTVHILLAKLQSREKAHFVSSKYY